MINDDEHSPNFNNPLDNSALVNRLADKAMALAAGDVEGTVKWLTSLGCKVTNQTADEATLVGLVNITVGISRGMDPVNAGVQLGFATAGMFWPQVYPGLLKEINRRWKEKGIGYSQAGRPKA